jgi:hypothetical protein
MSERAPLRGVLMFVRGKLLLECLFTPRVAAAGVSASQGLNLNLIWSTGVGRDSSDRSCPAILTDSDKG